MKPALGDNDSAVPGDVSRQTIVDPEPGQPDPAAGAAGSGGSADLKRSAVRGVGWSIAQIGGNQAVSFGVFVVLGRILVPLDFGLAASAVVIIQAMRVIVDAGFSNALIQKDTMEAEDADTAFWTALAVAFAFAALTVALAPLLALLFHQPRVTGLIDALTPIYVFVALDSTQTALLQRELQFRLQTIRRLIASVVSAAVAVGLAIAGAGVWALVAQQLTLEGLSVLLLWTLSPWRPSRRFSRQSFREMFRFGWRYSAIRILWFLNSSADNFLVAAFLGPLALGYYAIAYRILTIFNNMVVMPVNIVAIPMFARLKGRGESVNSALYRVSRISATLGLPVYAGTAIIAHPLLTFLFGARWAPSAPVLVALTVAGVLQCQGSFLPSYMIAIGRIHNELPWLFTVVCCQIVGFVIAAQFGIVAVAVALDVVMFVSLPVRLLYLRRQTGVSLREYFDRYPGLLAATACMAGIVWAVSRAQPTMGLAASLFIEIAAGAVTYPLALRLLAPEALRELLETLSGMRDRRAVSA